MGNITICRNDYRLPTLIIFISLLIFIIILLIIQVFYSTIPISLLEIGFITITLAGSAYALWDGGRKYSLILGDDYIQILSKRYKTTQLKYVSFVPLIKPKGKKIYGYIVFYFQKPHSHKYKKVGINGGFIDDHYKLLDFFQKHRIRYGEKRGY